MKDREKEEVRGGYPSLLFVSGEVTPGEQLWVPQYMGDPELLNSVQQRARKMTEGVTTSPIRKC